MANNVDTSGWPSAPKERISILNAVSMIGFALFCDGIQGFAVFLNGVPAIGTIIDVAFSWIISIFATVVFGVWFAICGVYGGQNASKKMLIMFSTVVVELVPIIDALPAITFGVVALIIQTRIEDGGLSNLPLMGQVAAINPMLGSAVKMAQTYEKTTGQGNRPAVPARSASRAHEAGQPLPPQESVQERNQRRIAYQEELRRRRQIDTASKSNTDPGL